MIRQGVLCAGLRLNNAIYWQEKRLYKSGRPLLWEKKTISTFESNSSKDEAFREQEDLRSSTVKLQIFL